MFFSDLFNILRKSFLDLEHYNLKRPFLLFLISTILCSVIISFFIYLFLFDQIAEWFVFESDNKILNFIFNSYFFALILGLIKTLFGLTLFGVILVPLGSLISGFLADDIFDRINSNQQGILYPYKRKKNAQMESLKFSIIAALKSLLLNIVLLPLYLFLPIANIFIFIFANAYFISREFTGNFLIQFHDKNYIKNYFLMNNEKMYTIGCLISFLYTIPIINFFAAYMANVVYANMIFEIQKKN